MGDTEVKQAALFDDFVPVGGPAKPLAPPKAQRPHNVTLTISTGPTMLISIGQGVMERLGWVKDGVMVRRVKAHEGTGNSHGSIMLAPIKEPQGQRGTRGEYSVTRQVTMDEKNNRYIIQCTPKYFTTIIIPNEKRPAAEVEINAFNGCLFIKMPEWAHKEA